MNCLKNIVIHGYLSIQHLFSSPHPSQIILAALLDGAIRPISRIFGLFLQILYFSDLLRSDNLLLDTICNAFRG
jgi:hypothetical protein